MSVKIEGLNEFTKEMVEICSKEYPKQVKKMLQKSGNKLRKKIASHHQLLMQFFHAPDYISR